MGISYTSLGGVSPHQSTHIAGGTDEIKNPIDAKAIVDARNKIGSTSLDEAQDYIDSLGIVYNNVTGFKNIYKASDDLFYSDNDSEVAITETEYTELKVIAILDIHPSPCTVRIYFEMKNNTGYEGVYAKIYKDETPVGTQQHIGANHYQEWFSFSEDITGWSGGNCIKIYGKKVAPAHGCIRNFRVFGKLVTPTLREAISFNTVGSELGAWLF